MFSIKLWRKYVLIGLLVWDSIVIYSNYTAAPTSGVDYDKIHDDQVYWIAYSIPFIFTLVSYISHRKCLVLVPNLYSFYLILITVASTFIPTIYITDMWLLMLTTIFGFLNALFCVYQYDTQNKIIKEDDTAYTTLSSDSVPHSLDEPLRGPTIPPTRTNSENDSNISDRKERTSEK